MKHKALLGRVSGGCPAAVYRSAVVYLRLKQVTRVIVDPGICGFNTLLEAIGCDGVVKVEIRSECEDIKALAKILTEVSLQDLMDTKFFTKNKVYRNADRCIRHLSCPIMCAIMKAVEVELGLALKKDVTIKFV